MTNILGYFFSTTNHVFIFLEGMGRSLASSCFQDAVKDSGGVRFFRKFEQVKQISDYGLENILSNIIQPCIENKWSIISSTKLHDSYAGSKNMANLAMAIFESCVISEGCIDLCKACYTLEGDSPLILTAHCVFSDIESNFE